MLRKYRIADEQIIRKEIYLFIKKYAKENKTVPLHREIADEVGVSITTVERRMKDLEALGLIINERSGKPRGYRVATAKEVKERS